MNKGKLIHLSSSYIVIILSIGYLLAFSPLLNLALFSFKNNYQSIDIENNLSLHNNQILTTSNGGFVMIDYLSNVKRYNKDSVVISNSFSLLDSNKYFVTKANDGQFFTIYNSLNGAVFKKVFNEQYIQSFATGIELNNYVIFYDQESINLYNISKDSLSKIFRKKINHDDFENNINGISMLENGKLFYFKNKKQIVLYDINTSREEIRSIDSNLKINVYVHHPYLKEFYFTNNEGIYKLNYNRLIVCELIEKINSDCGVTLSKNGDSLIYIHNGEIEIYNTRLQKKIFENIYNVDFRGLDIIKSMDGILFYKKINSNEIYLYEIKSNKGIYNFNSKLNKYNSIHLFIKLLILILLINLLILYIYNDIKLYKFTIIVFSIFTFGFAYVIHEVSSITKNSFLISIIGIITSLLIFSRLLFFIPFFFLLIPLIITAYITIYYNNKNQTGLFIFANILFYISLLSLFFG